MLGGPIVGEVAIGATRNIDSGKVHMRIDRLQALFFSLLFVRLVASLPPVAVFAPGVEPPVSGFGDFYIRACEVRFFGPLTYGLHSSRRCAQVGAGCCGRETGRVRACVVSCMLGLVSLRKRRCDCEC